MFQMYLKILVFLYEIITFLLRYLNSVRANSASVSEIRADDSSLGIEILALIRNGVVARILNCSPLSHSIPNVFENIIFPMGNHYFSASVS